MNPLPRPSREELERELAATSVPPPPPDLLDRIRREIPENLPAAAGGSVARFPARRSPIRRFLPLAATLALAVSGTYVAVRVARERSIEPRPAARELVPVDTIEPARAQSAAAPAAPAELKPETSSARPASSPRALPAPVAAGATNLAEKSAELGAVAPSRVASTVLTPREERQAPASRVAAASPAAPPRADDRAGATVAFAAGGRAEGGLDRGVEGGVEGGVAGGVAGGVPGGVVGGAPGGVAGGSPGGVVAAPAVGRALREERRNEIVAPVEVPAAAGRADAFRAKEAPSTGGTAEPNDQPVGDMFFRATGVNPFVDTEDDRFSTFGLDVDTGSYTLARTYLDGGHLPPPEAIRVEEFVNAFDYPERADRRRDFTVHAEGAPSPFARGERVRLVRFHVETRPIAEQDRRPADLIFVVDVSGSMGRDDRLGLVRQALGLLLGRLREDDRVGLVVYGTRGRVLLAPTGDHAAVRRALAQLVPEGSTNAEEGLRLAYDLAAESFRRGAVRRLILCSDGVANVGATGPESILARIGAAAREGVELSSFGFGMGNYNDALLEQLADQGNGRYAYVDDLAEAERLFVEQAAATVPTVARDAKAQVEWNPRTVERYRLLGYENRDIADERFRDDRVDAGEIGAGHAVTALYEIKLRDGAGSWLGGERLATLRLRYREAASGAVRESAYDFERGAIAARWSEASTNLRLAAVAAELAERLKGSIWRKEAPFATLLAEARSLARERPEARELARLVERAAALAGPDRREVEPGGGDDPPPSDAHRLAPRDEGQGGPGER